MTAAASFDELIGRLDVSIFQIESQTSADDRRSFLAIQNAVRRWKGDYVYLECGSHVGGSLLPHILDPRCKLLYSVDKRPQLQPDERGVSYEYPQNSSQRMLALLAEHASAAHLAKLHTFDLDASALTVSQIQVRPDLILIDAEHTISAVFRDFLNLHRLCHPATIYVFHDAHLTFSGLQNIETFLRYSGVVFDSYVLPSIVYVLATNDAREALRPVGEKFGLNMEQFAAAARDQLMMFHYEVVRRSMEDPKKSAASGECSTTQSSLGNQPAQIVTIKEDEILVLKGQGLQLYEQRRLDEALATFDKVLALDSNSVEAHYNRANVLEELQRLDTALAAYDMAIALKPDFVFAHNNRGLILQKMKRYESALDSYNKALSIDPNYVNAKTNRDLLLRQMPTF
jgi:hypothetical protein